MSAHRTRLIALVGLASFALIIVAVFVSPPLWSAPGENSRPPTLQPTFKPITDVQSPRSTSTALRWASSFALARACGRGCARSSHRASRCRPPSPSARSRWWCSSWPPFATAGVASYRPQQPALALLLSDLTFGFLALSGIPTAVCLGAYAALVLRYRCLPAWTGWLAVLGAVAHVLIAASFMNHGSFLSLEGAVNVAVPATFFAWILVTSIALLRAGPLAQAMI